MPFDNVDYAQVPSLVYPIGYHPKSPTVPDAVADSLRGVFASARHHSQMCWQTQPGFNLERPSVYFSPEKDLWAPARTAYGALGAGYHLIPPHVTHLCCAASMLAGHLAPDAAGHFRLVLRPDEKSTGAGTVDTGSDFAVNLPPPPDGVEDFDAVAADAGRFTTQHALYSPFHESIINAFDAYAEVAIANGSSLRGTVAYSTFQGYAVFGVSPAGIRLKPLHVLCWWECRG